MMMIAATANQVLERIDELARMLERGGDVRKAATFARELHREAAAHVIGDVFMDYEYGDEADDA
jgi:hypothetical protein